MKRLAATNVVAQRPHQQINAVKSRRWRPAVEHIGMDVHKRESQLCIVTEQGEVLEQRIRTERGRLAEVLRGRARAKILLEAIVLLVTNFNSRTVEFVDLARLPVRSAGVPGGAARTP